MSTVSVSPVVDHQLDICPDHAPPFPDMVWIPGGTFRMGSDKHYPEERPSHRVTVDGFWMDRYPVTNARFARFPMGKIDGTEMWQVGEGVRARRGTYPTPIHPVTAGIYIATMMAQVDLLAEKGHPYSEIANESIIEAVDSLNPYMHFKGVAHMIDNCSTTARLGARKWAPRFDYNFMQQTFPALDAGTDPDESLMKEFLENGIHGVLAKCSEYRPTVDIAILE